MNPTAQPFGAPPAQPRNDQLNLAAILLMVSAALAIAFALFSLLTAVAGGDGAWVLNFIKDESIKRQVREAMQQNQGSPSMVANMLWPLLILAANAFILFAGTKMKNAQAYSLSMAGAILATIPCCFTSCCCVTSMPAGIFALVLLMKPEVKASFTN